MTRNGIATKVAATTAPEVWNGSTMPKVFSSQPPSSPRRPKPRSSATPPTVGGSTIGSSTSERTSALPGKLTRASSQASGTPSSSDSPSAQNETTSDSRSASRTSGLVRWVPRSFQGVRARMPTSGISKNAMATSAGTASARGVRVPGARSLPAGGGASVRGLLIGVPGIGAGRAGVRRRARAGPLPRAGRSVRAAPDHGFWKPAC